MTEYERRREEIAKLLCSEDGWDWEQINEEYRHLGDSIARSTYRGIAAQILSLNGIEIRADDQSLPKGLTARLNLPDKEHYIYGEEALSQAGFIKVAPKEE